METGSDTSFNSVWGSSTHVFTVGSNGAIFQYDGSAWSTMNTTMIIRDIWGSSASNVFAVSYEGTIYHYDGVSATTTINGKTSTTSTGNFPTTTTSVSSCPSESLYGEHSEKTELLRYIRDNLLAQAPYGQEIIRLYYEWSPVIVKAMEEDEECKAEVTEMLDWALELMRGKTD